MERGRIGSPRKWRVKLSHNELKLEWKNGGKKEEKKNEKRNEKENEKKKKKRDKKKKETE